MATDLLALADHNYETTSAALARIISGDAPINEDGLLLASSRSPISFFNGAFLRPSASRSVLDRVVRSVEFFAEQGVPFVIRSRLGVAPDLPDAAETCGLVQGSLLPLMALPVIRDVPDAPAGLEVRRVDDRASLDLHLDVVSASFGIGRDLAEHLFSMEMIDAPGTVLLVGLVDGRAVCTSLLSATEEMAGIYNVATLDPHRRSGLGTAMTWEAIRIGRDEGATSACLQASEMGRPVYERMGFLVLDDYHQFSGG